MITDWAYSKYHNAWILDSASSLRGFPAHVQGAKSRSIFGCPNLWVGFIYAVLRKHSVSLRLLLQQGFDAQGHSTSNGSSDDLRIHCWLVLPMAELGTHFSPVHCLPTQVDDLDISRAWNRLPTGKVLNRFRLRQIIKKYIFRYFMRSTKVSKQFSMWLSQLARHR